METIKTFNKISYDQISYAKIRLMVRVYYKIENDLPKNMTKYKLDNILREKIRNTPYHNDNRYYVYHYLIDYYNNNNNNDELENDITKEELNVGLKDRMVGVLKEYIINTKIEIMILEKRG